jgi:putative ABC transport system permease protein
LGFGVFPAFQISKANLHDSLKETMRGTSFGAERHRMRSILVASELALSVIVLVGAGLMIQSLGKLTGIDPGFDPEHVFTAQFNLPAVRYKTDDDQNAFMNRLLERMSGISGVSMAATTSSLPFSGGSMVISYTIMDHPPVLPQNQPSAAIRFITPNYFRLLHVPIIKGREFTERDRAGATQAVIINEALARREFPDEDPIGKRMSIGYGNGKTRTEPFIVGIVKDMKITDIRGDAEPQYYLPFAQLPFSSVSLALRTAGDPGQLTATVRAVMKDLDPDIALFNVRPFKEVVVTSIAQSRFNAVLLGAFAGVALVLASVGVYGVMAYSVTQRTHEIGIRLALGQSRSSVMQMVVSQAFFLALAGIGAGIGGALALTRFMTSMLFHVNATDLRTFAAVTITLMGVAVIAGFLPAHRATRVDPIIALRSE